MEPIIPEVKSDSQKHFSRRSFLKAVGIFAVVLGLRPDITIAEKEITAGDISPEKQERQRHFLKSLGVIDFLKQDKEILDKLNLSELLQKLFELIEIWYSNPNLENAKKITDLFILLVLKQYSDHGNTVLKLIEAVVAYFNAGDLELNSRDLDNQLLDIAELFDIHNVSIERFEDFQNGFRGVDIEVTMDAKALFEFLEKNPALKVLNMSFQYGLHKLRVTLEQRRVQDYFYFIDENNRDMFSLCDQSLGIPGIRKNEDGKITIWQGNNELSIFPDTEEGKNAALKTMPYVKLDTPAWHIDEPYKESRESIESLLEMLNPEVLICSSAGNTDSFSPYTPAPNCILSGTLKEVVVDNQTYYIINGNADIYIPESKDLEPLLHLDQSEETNPIDSSSESAALVSALLAIILKKYPQLSQLGALKNFFLEQYTNTKEMQVYLGNSRKAEASQIRILDLEKVISDLLIK